MEFVKPPPADTVASSQLREGRAYFVAHVERPIVVKEYSGLLTDSATKRVHGEAH